MMANLSFNDPFEALLSIQRALEARLASDWLGGRTSGMGSFPPINIFQQEHDFVAIVELPGVDKSDLAVEVKENTIRISGHKTIDYGDVPSFHRRERVWGSFDRSISVPIQIDPDGVKAEYQDGVLALFIPRAQSDKPRSIEIK
jgi:HSP20 family protein